MSPQQPIDHRYEASAQSDEALRKAHAESGQGPSGRGVMLPIGLTVLFAVFAFAAGIYLERYSGGFSPLAYNEDASSMGAAATVPKAVDPVALGKRQFNAACVTCHQETGLGLPGTYPPLVGSEWVQGNEDRLIRIVLHGLGGEIQVEGKPYNGAMPAFGRVPGGGYNWRDDQIAAVLTYIRQEWGNKAPAVSTEKVAAIRTQSQRAQPWTAAELQAIP